MISEFLKTIGPFFNKLFVIERLFNDDVQEPQGKGMICSGSQLEPGLGLAGKFALFRINNNKFGPVSYLFKQQAAYLPLLIGRGDIAPP